MAPVLLSESGPVVGDPTVKSFSASALQDGHHPRSRTFSADLGRSSPLQPSKMFQRRPDSQCESRSVMMPPIESLIVQWYIWSAHVLSSESVSCHVFDVV